MTTTVAPLRQPDAFERTLYIVGEINSLTLTMSGQASKLRTAREKADRPQMLAALTELQRLCTQTSDLVGVASRAITGGK